MRRGAIKVESKGSYWWLDEAEQEYLRLPKEEKPRANPEWGGPGADEGLQDAVWHPYVTWSVDAVGRLIIKLNEDENPLCVYAPDARVVTA